MRKVFLTLLFVALCAVPSFAQDDYDKFKFFAGYSHNRVDTGVDNDDPELDDFIDEREGFNGFNASIQGNVSRYVGLKFDYSFHRRSFDDGLGNNVDARLHNFLGGVQIQDNSRGGGRVRPFAHALVGAARLNFDLSEFDDEFVDFGETGFAAALGGGVDVRVNNRVSVRAIQFDWNPTRFDFNNFGNGNGVTGDNSQTLHNFRIGVGIVFH
jgi:opacity protein-like surface antigen